MRFRGKTKRERATSYWGWRKKFALIPREIADGVWIWLEWFEWRYVPWPKEVSLFVSHRPPRIVRRASGDNGVGYPEPQDEKWKNLPPPPTPKCKPLNGK